MIRSFRIYAEQEKVWCVFLEYGDQDVTVEQIELKLTGLGVSEFDHAAIEAGLAEGTYSIREISVALPSNLAGACWAEVKEEGEVTIHAAPCLGHGCTIGPKDVDEEVDKAGFKEYFHLDDVIKRNLQALPKSPKAISFHAAEKRDATLEIDISPDRKTAYFSYFPPCGGSHITFEQAMAKLHDAGVVAGIDEDRLRGIEGCTEKISRQQVAVSTDAEDGKDASIEYRFDVSGANTGPRINEKDLANYRDLGLFECFELGAELAVKIPATEGVSGLDIFREIHRPQERPRHPASEGQEHACQRQGSECARGIGFRSTQARRGKSHHGGSA